MSIWLNFVMKFKIHVSNYNLTGGIFMKKSTWQYFVECYTKNFFNFSGRATRKEFISFHIWLWGILIGSSILFGILMQTTK